MYLIKLFNGEDIVCNIKPTTSKEHTTIQNPMKMNTHPAITDTGIMETLSLSSWLHPYTEESNIKIKKSAIVTVAPASPGLVTFYNRDSHPEKRITSIFYFSLSLLLYLHIDQEMKP